MKRSFFYLSMVIVAVSTAISLTGCGEEVTLGEQPAGSKEGMTVFSSVADDTRTTIDATGLFYWQSKNENHVLTNDQIWIDEAGTGVSFSLQSSSSEFYNGNRSGKFYFRGLLNDSTYKLSYTGHGSTTGDEVTIASIQQQLGWDNASHIGTSGDCATAKATKQSNGNYSFTLNHKASYLIFQPYAPASTNLNPYRLSEIEILDTEGNVLAGTFPLKFDGLETNAGRDTHTKIVVSCSELNGEALTLPQSASKSIYAVILPRGGAEGGRALQVRYRVNTVSDGNFIVVQNISANFEVNGARLIRHDLSVPAFPTVPTFVSDGNGLFGGTKFKPAFLYRTSGNATTGTNLLQLAEMKDDPFILLRFNQGAHGVAINEWQKRMFFTWNELVEIFGYAAQGQGANWATTTATAASITNSKTIVGKNYRLPTIGEYSKLIETPNSGRAIVNYYPASFASVIIDLSGDGTYSTLGWNRTTSGGTANVNASYIAGYLFFPDEAFILDAKIDVASLNGRWGTASNLTADELRNYINHGCMFLPAAGYSIGSNWANRGTGGLYWSGSINYTTPSQAMMFGISGSHFDVINLTRTYYFNVVLVEKTA